MRGEVGPEMLVLKVEFDGLGEVKDGNGVPGGGC